ncbi:hypothetical protein FDJ62_gp34 [Acinetobacter phage Loki]|uniref:Uncharacterized protein n=1 Tax=Acinetobacter phage Loki TaxID=1970374 RepID=A0A0N7MKQ0_9CAUD|nr:hypothetical protein FDJ62_gp34 [Acinetobacter phage Loki]CUS06495.1 hypothetical protein [Acinetobacter phage Loki]
MDKVTLAKTIAAKINNYTQDEINAMIVIVCELHNVEFNELYKMVGNIYYQANRSKMAAVMKVKKNHLNRINFVIDEVAKTI